MPFRRNFIAGILTVFLADFLASRVQQPWILYIGVAIGGALCVADVFKALTEKEE